MFRLPFEVKRARRRRDLTLDFGQISRIHRKHDAGRRGMPGRSVNQTGRRVVVFIKERAAEDYLATQAATVAAATLIRLPAIENPVRQYFRQYPAPRRAVGMLRVKEAYYFAEADVRFLSINFPLGKRRQVERGWGIV